jgi:hypothetical protein
VATRSSHVTDHICGRQNVAHRVPEAVLSAESS